MKRSSLSPLIVWIASILMATAADWVRPEAATHQPVWGVRGGLHWAVAPGGFRPGEPRGLLRLGCPVLSEQRYDLVNFIAIEPIVKGRRGYSELENSLPDRVKGKRISADGDGRGILTNFAGKPADNRADKIEQLEVVLRVEKFENGAHVRLVVRQRADRPDEIELSVCQEPDSAPLDFCILTATMGNMARTRNLWLADEVISSLELYRGHQGSGFAAPTEYPLPRLHRTVDGGVLVAVTNDEQNPAAVYPFQNSEFWHYGGRTVTQYWAKPAGAFRDVLRVVVNARYTYWQSARPIPGGVAFENFELRESFYNGQKFIFGITERRPEEL